MAYRTRSIIFLITVFTTSNLYAQRADSVYYDDNTPDCESEGFTRFHVQGIEGGTELLLDVNNHVLVKNFKLNDNLNLFSVQKSSTPFTFTKPIYARYFDSCGWPNDSKYPIQSVVISHEVNGDLKQDHFDFLRTAEGYKLIMVSWPQILPPWADARFKKEFSSIYEPAKYIDQGFLEADFSGDQINDVAILIERKDNRKKGILILFDKSDRSFVVGAGNELGPTGDDLDWAGYWEIFTGSEAVETTLTKDGDIDAENVKVIKLKHPAISIRQNEGSGGLIYFDGKKLKWIHQGD